MSEMLDDAERDRLARRRDAALVLLGSRSNPACTDRLTTAPAPYVLAHASSDLARHCELLDPRPPPGAVRLVATPARGDHRWHLDIATRDRPGLLAAFSGVLARFEIGVTQAVLATWPDGTALQAFTVRASDLPFLADLQRALAGALGSPLTSDPAPDAAVRFDGASSGLYTSCEITAADRPGLLHSFAVAIAAVGVDIHAASVDTHDGIARDRFDLSDARGHKLDATLERLIVAQLRAGTRAPRIASSV
jgi:[protein-PII] uridylyltransferase